MNNGCLTTSPFPLDILWHCSSHVKYLSAQGHRCIPPFWVLLCHSVLCSGPYFLGDCALCHLPVSWCLYPNSCLVLSCICVPVQTDICLSSVKCTRRLQPVVSSLCCITGFTLCGSSLLQLPARGLPLSCLWGRLVGQPRSQPTLEDKCFSRHFISG